MNALHLKDLYNRQGGLVDLTLSLILTLFLGGDIVWYLRSNESAKGYVILLFVLTAICAQVAAWRLGPSWSRYRWSLFVAIFHCVLWAIYIFISDKPEILPVAGISYWLGLSAFLGETCLVLMLTSYLILNKGSGFLSDLEEDPLTALSCYFSLFFLVTFTLTFSLAFHDRSSSGPGLYVRQLANGRSKVGVSAEHKAFTQRLWFREGSARLEASEPDDATIDPLTEMQCLASMSKDQNRLPICLNRSGLVEIKKFVDAHPSSQRLRISVLGHANDKAVQSTVGRYRSNFELSQARVLEAQRSVHRALSLQGGEAADDHNIEWFLSPVSNEETFLIAGKAPASLDPKLGVEIGIDEVKNHLTELQLRDLRQPAHRLELLDYLYFMVYTITTTGYGDMVPITPEAKFITILANLFEVLFIVVFLNVLISGRGGQRSPGGKARGNGKSSNQQSSPKPILPLVSSSAPNSSQLE